VAEIFVGYHCEVLAK